MGSFPSIWRTSFNIYFRLGLLTRKALSFALSENVFISFLKDIFMGCRILSWHFFCFWSVWLLSEICNQIFILLLVTCHFSLAALKISLFPFIFTVWLWWFYLNLYCLIFPELLASVNLCLSLNLLSLFLQKIFSMPISFSSQGLQLHVHKDLFRLSHGSSGFVYFSTYFLSFLLYFCIFQFLFYLSKVTHNVRLVSGYYVVIQPLYVILSSPQVYLPYVMIHCY